MIDPIQLLIHIIRPVLKHLELWSVGAERLVLGTACQESECGRWLVQINGPALGAWQMEPATHDDIVNNYLAFRPELKSRVGYWAAQGFTAPQLAWNLGYGEAMCRLRYRRIPRAIPDTLQGQAEYYKINYNTPLGAGTAQQYVSNWQRFVGNQKLPD